MARYPYKRTTTDGFGYINPSTSVVVSETGTSTPATIYVSEAGAVISNSTITSGTDGSYEFWVDDSDYALTKRFRTVASKTGFVTKTNDDIVIFPVQSGTNNNLTGPITSVGNATSIASQTGTGTKFVVDTSPTLVTPLLGTPASGVLTNCTGLPVAGLANGTDGELYTWSAAGASTTVAVGTAGNVLTSGGVGVAPTFQPGGFLVNAGYVNISTVADDTGTIPFDNTIPQNTEGYECMTLAYTPGNTANRLQIDATIFCSNAANTTITAALFQDTTADALAATGVRQATADGMVTIYLRHVMVANIDTSTTFKVRIGGHTASGDITFNGTATVRRYNGVAQSSISILEFLP